MANRFRILTLNNIAPVGLERLPADQYEVGNQVKNPDAILVRSHDMHAMEIAPEVRAIARAGAGTNNIPVKQMNARGVPVFNAPGANANAVKELVLAGMLIAARNLAPAIQFVASLPADAPDERDTANSAIRPILRQRRFEAMVPGWDRESRESPDPRSKAWKTLL